MKFRSIVAEADVPNANGRIYPKAVLESIANDTELQKRISEGRELGLFRMPECTYENGFVLDLSRISHKVTKVKMLGYCLDCEIDILEDTPAGKEVMKFLHDTPNDTITVRLAGYGVVNKQGIVQEGYKLHSLNIVKKSEAA